MEETHDVLIREDLSADRPLPRPGDPANVIDLSTSSPTFSGSRGAGYRIERVRVAERDRVLIVTAPGSTLRRNGLPAPLIAPLGLGDQLAWDANTLLHVSRRQRAAAIRPPAALVGRPCEVCQVAFEPTTLVVLCPICGEARHLEGAEVPESERLECADLGACPVCQTERPREDGFVYWPEVRG